VSIARGDRIAQLIIQPVSLATFVPVSELPKSARGIGGYGSTGGVLGSASEQGAFEQGAFEQGAVDHEAVDQEAFEPDSSQRGNETVSVPRERA
jgi:hypothetical protein